MALPQASLSVVARLAAVATLCGCSQFEVYLRPERTAYVAIPERGDGKLEHLLPLRDAKGQPFKIELSCLDRQGALVTAGSRSAQAADQCLYYSVETKQLTDAFARLVEPAERSDRTLATAESLRNAFISYLLNISDQNCSTFLNRSFANKATFDTGKGIFQDVITGAGAALANASPHTSAGLGLTNLVLGKSVDNVNTTFYFEKTFQAMAAAIEVERRDVLRVAGLLRLDDIERATTPASAGAQRVAVAAAPNGAASAPAESRPAGRRTAFGRSYESYTLHDALSDLREYDDACSIRRGLARLQRLAQDVKAQEGAARKAQDVADVASAEKDAAGRAVTELQFYVRDLEGALRGANDQIDKLSSDLQAGKKQDGKVTELQRQLNSTQSVLVELTRRLQAASDAREQRQSPPRTPAPQAAQPAPANSTGPASTASQPAG